MSKELIEQKKTVLSPIDLTYLAYSINQVGGGGNLKELYNPNNEGGIVGLVEELNSQVVPFCSIEQLDPSSTVCCVARLGKPGAKADQYVSQAAKAIVQGLETLAKTKKMLFPSTIFPVEATAGQMARITRTLLAANNKGHNISLLDEDVCGGMAVPAIPLAFNITQSLNNFSHIALIRLKSERSKIVPSIDVIEEKDPFNLERKLREMAVSSEMGTVWFAWLMCQASDFSDYFILGAVTSSIRRGRLVNQVIDDKQDPAELLSTKGETINIITRGTIIELTDESQQALGFAQFSYKIRIDSEEILTLAARNEYIVVYDKNGQIIAKAPNIISVIGENGPIQSHILKPGCKIVVVEVTPQTLINQLNKEKEWLQIWQKYWRDEKNNGRWIIHTKN